jgi:SAM-dependent methyltransferase
MSGTVFGPGYADLYDTLYSDKDYGVECDMIERAFREFGAAPVQSILDLGCGTGSHAIPLALRGYDVVGVDRSEAMLLHAQSKAVDAGVDNHAVFIAGDVRNVDAGRTVDAVLIMFSVLGYQYSDDDVLATLATARRHMQQGGELLFDVWYGPAVLSQRPEERVKRMKRDTGEIVRRASSMLHEEEHLCTVRYSIQQSADPAGVQVEEEHQVRYFFSDELERFLTLSGFALQRLGAFHDYETDPDESTWNVLCVAVAV